ncbi:MAG: hypothetical protein HC908_00565 [Calothrix sp. SM1_7_51]|nr:hypothetical protein [Calothrix sp. SM1_7_51]
MAEYLNGLENLEQEVASYRSKFQESYEVLDELAKIKLEFSGFSQKYQELDENYQKLTAYINEAKGTLKNLQSDSKSQMEQVIQAEDNLNQRLIGLEKSAVGSIQQAQDNFNQRFAAFEKTSEEKWDRFSNALVRKIQEQNKDFEALLDIAVKDWDNRFGEIKAGLDKLDSKLEVTTRLIQEVKINTKQQLAGFQARINQSEESISQVNQRINETETAIYIVAGIGCVLAALLAILPFWLQQRNNDAVYRQQVEKIRE